MKKTTPIRRFAEHERVRFVRGISDEGIAAGETGTVVHGYGPGYGYEVEVIQDEATKVATVRAADIEACKD